MKISIEIEMGKESCAIATLLNRAAYMIRREGWDSSWQEYADLADKFRDRLDKVIWDTSHQKAIDSTRKS